MQFSTTWVLLSQWTHLEITRYSIVIEKELNMFNSYVRCLEISFSRNIFESNVYSKRTNGRSSNATMATTSNATRLNIEDLKLDRRLEWSHFKKHNLVGLIQKLLGLKDI